MQALIEQNQQQARQILIQNPPLTKALFQVFYSSLQKLFLVLHFFAIFREISCLFVYLLSGISVIRVLGSIKFRIFMLMLDRVFVNLDETFSSTKLSTYGIVFTLIIQGPCSNSCHKAPLCFSYYYEKLTYEPVNPAHRNGADSIPRPWRGERVALPFTPPKWLMVVLASLWYFRFVHLLEAITSVENRKEMGSP